MLHFAPVEATLRPVHPLLTSPIFPTIMRLATPPNLVSLTIGTCVVIAETSYIGRLGKQRLAHAMGAVCSGWDAALFGSTKRQRDRRMIARSDDR